MPDRPSIYHITHVDNLRSIAMDGLSSDAEMVARGGPAATVGMSEIKRRRLLELPVKCHPGDYVGEYVPFFFCPRSIMLYILHMANHPSLDYHGGQEPIIHLEGDLHEAVAWAESEERRWAFALSNAGAAYTEFRKGLDRLDDLDWAAIESRDFREVRVKEGKQAEFLIRDVYPWRLVRSVGVHSEEIKQAVLAALEPAEHQPPVNVRPDWYY